MRSTQILILVAIAVLGSPLAFAGDRRGSEVTSNTFLNGRGWLSFSENERMTYLIGLDDGLQYASWTLPSARQSVQRRY